MDGKLAAAEEADCDCFDPAGVVESAVASVHIVMNQLVEALDEPGADPHAQVVWEGPRRNPGPYPDSLCYFRSGILFDCEIL